MQLQEILKTAGSLDSEAMQQARERWDSVAKPLHGLGLLEDAIVRIAGITGTSAVTLSKKVLVVLCADNGVTAQGVTQTGSEITALVAENLSRGESSCCKMASVAGTDVVPVDIGMARDVFAPKVLQRKVAYGTGDISQGPAMTEEETQQAILTGISLVKELREQGYRMIATGEMGIGNTTTSSAVASVLLGQPVEFVTGRGAGLSDEGLRRKIRVIQTAVEKNRPDPQDPLSVLAKLGGFDIAGMAGLFLGGAVYRVPIVIDGFISSIAALLAAKICPLSREYMLPSHVSKEPAGRMVLEELGLKPVVTAELCLGEGTGALTLFPLLDMAHKVYAEMSTFTQIHMEPYTPQGGALPC